MEIVKTKSEEIKKNIVFNTISAAVFVIAGGIVLISRNENTELLILGLFLFHMAYYNWTENNMLKIILELREFEQ